ncbi:MAG: hypothetical protein ACR2GD_11095 [Pyrinomonadaceae bacterium]
MKVCPTCQQTYADESLNFCLNDGAVLVQQSASPKPPQTIFMNQPSPTSPEKGFGQNPQANWAINSPTVNQPKRKSKTWLWVLGIFGALILVCGGGLVGLIAIVANDDNTNVSGNTYRNLNVGNYKPNNLLTDDLSNWKIPNDNLGITDYQNGEFYMTSKSGGYYFVLLSGDKNFRTDNATTGVTVRNTTGAQTQSGFGLMVHNNISMALAQDYDLLVNTVNQAYRIIEHQARKEIVLVDWTDESAIKSGSQPNKLEVKDDNGKMSFYINGKLVKTIEDKDGIKSGVAGLYVSGAVPIAFSKLQVEK